MRGTGIDSDVEIYVEMILSKLLHWCFPFGRSPVLILAARRPDVLTTVSSGFLQSLQTNTSRELLMRPRPLNFKPFPNDF
jgi:hypothetical protein